MHFSQLNRIHLSLMIIFYKPLPQLAELTLCIPVVFSSFFLWWKSFEQKNHSQQFSDF